MTSVRWETVTDDGTAEFQVQYGGKTAKIKLEGLDTTGWQEEPAPPWTEFYLKCFKELFDAIQAKDTHWTDRHPGGKG
ncbi:hypothetical protein [Polaromonas sp. JS666]|uniref:hypothetical protein n=1 Tax=Polaromonas sp. (strain JS666 / ATCC BAA-500) TaxID=296591 RepID=UPI0000464972|nr:hypothetical protein [Polaromonas sp. JS666]